MPAVVLVLALLLGALEAILVHHRALHAASVGARLAARGQSSTQVTGAVLRSGVAGAQVTTRKRGEDVVVRVEPRLPAAVSWALPDLSAEVSARREDALDNGEEAS